MISLSELDATGTAGRRQIRPVQPFGNRAPFPAHVNKTVTRWGTSAEFALRLPRACQALRVAAARIPKACNSRRDDQGLPPFPMRIPCPPRPCSYILAATPSSVLSGTARSNLHPPAMLVGGRSGAIDTAQADPFDRLASDCADIAQVADSISIQQVEGATGGARRQGRTFPRKPGNRRTAREPPKQRIKEASKEAVSQHLRCALLPSLATLPLSARCPLLPAVPPPSPPRRAFAPPGPPRTPPPVVLARRAWTRRQRRLADKPIAASRRALLSFGRRLVPSIGPTSPRTVWARLWPPSSRSRLTI